jgi:hypothetical protein
MSTLYVYCTNVAKSTGGSQSQVRFDLDLWFNGAEVETNGLTYDLATLPPDQLRSRIVLEAVKAWNAANAGPIQIDPAADDVYLVNFPRLELVKHVFA